MKKLGLFIVGLLIASSLMSQNCIVADYPFNGNANDLINGNNGILNNVVTAEDRYGNQNSAYHFEDSSYIEIPHSSSLEFINEQAISIWFKIDSIPSSSDSVWSLLTKQLSAGESQKGINIKLKNTNSNNKQLHIKSKNGLGSNAYNLKCDLSILKIGSYNHMCWSINSDTSFLYINGNPVASGPGSFSFPFGSNTESIFIGRMPVGGFPFKGEIDNMKLFDCYLNADSAYKLYCSTPSNVLGSIVDSDGNKISNGKVFLLSKNEMGRFEKVDSVDINTDDSTFTFSRVDSSDYLVLATPDESIYPEYIATYNGDKHSGNSSEIVQIKECNGDVNLTINAISLPKQTGVGRITGVITENGFNKTGKSEGDPIPDVDIVLEQIPGGVVAKAKTDNKGKFTFTDIERGNYQIKVDLPGMFHDSIYEVSITEEDTIFEGLDYDLDSLTIIRRDSIMSIDSKVDLNATIASIYPNPTRGASMLKIILKEADNALIRVVDLSGRVIFEEIVNLRAGFNTEVINIGKSGMYLVQIESKSLVSTERILVIE